MCCQNQHLNRQMHFQRSWLLPEKSSSHRNKLQFTQQISPGLINLQGSCWDEKVETIWSLKRLQLNTKIMCPSLMPTLASQLDLRIRKIKLLRNPKVQMRLQKRQIDVLNWIFSILSMPQWRIQIYLRKRSSPFWVSWWKPKKCPQFHQYWMVKRWWQTHRKSAKYLMISLHQRQLCLAMMIQCQILLQRTKYWLI